MRPRQRCRGLCFVTTVSPRIVHGGTLTVMRGTVRRRGNGWQALVKVRDSQSGEWKQMSATRPTKAAAEQWLRATLSRFGDAASVAHDATVGELLTAWFDMASGDWSPSTRRQTVSVVEAHLRPRWDDVKVKKVRAVDIDIWMNDLRKKRAASTVVRIFGVLRLAFEQAVRWDWVPVNPCDNARPPKQKRAQIKPPSIDELIALLNAAREHDPDVGAFVHLAAATGARRGELCALRWSAVDLDAGTVRIAEAVVIGEGDLAVLKDTKTGNVRRLTLDAGTVATLREHRARCAERALACGSSLPHTAFLFSLDADGSRPWRPDHATKQFERVRVKADIDGVRLHDLRHYQATRLLTSGVDLATVAGRLGHANGGKTTLAIYAHFLEHADRAAADVIGADLTRRKTARRR